MKSFLLLAIAVSALPAAACSPDKTASTSPAPTIARIEIVGPPSNYQGLPVGALMHLHLVGFDSASDTVAILLPVQWSSTDTAVAQVDATGAVTAYSKGKTYIRASVIDQGRWISDSLELQTVVVFPAGAEGAP